MPRVLSEDAVQRYRRDGVLFPIPALTSGEVERYREAVKELGSLTDLVAIARRLHAEDLESGATTTVTQMMAADGVWPRPENRV